MSRNTSGDNYEGRGNCFSGYGSGHCTNTSDTSSRGNERSDNAFTAGFAIGASMFTSAASGNSTKFMANVQAAKQLLDTPLIGVNAPVLNYSDYIKSLSYEEQIMINNMVKAGQLPKF
jgi:hypothetical protein